VVADVDSVWEREKMKIVPGEEVLSGLFSRYNLSYKKDRDGPQIAAKMHEDEIEYEVSKIIKEIVT
jgi:hypothetical protein